MAAEEAAASLAAEDAPYVQSLYHPINITQCTIPPGADALSPMYKRFIPTSQKPTNLFLAVQRRRQLQPRPGANFHNCTQFYSQVHPHTTAYGVQLEQEVQRVSWKAFSPNGKYLIGFLQTASMFRAVVYDVTQGFRDTEDIGQQPFNRFFQERSTVVVARTPFTLNKEFLLFSDCGNFLILASTKQWKNDSELLTQGAIGTVSLIEDTILHVISLSAVQEVSQLKFQHDCILTSHSPGVSMHGSRVAVLSVRFQKVYLYQLSQTGQLIHLMTIGEYCLPDDALFLQTSYPEKVSSPMHLRQLAPLQTFEEMFLPPPTASINGRMPHLLAEARRPYIGLKQRLITFLYREACAADNHIAAVREFYHLLPIYERLCMWKFQLIDESMMLLCFGAAEYADGLRIRRPQDSHIHHLLFVFYDYVNGVIVDILHNSDPKLLCAFEASASVFKQSLVKTALLNEHTVSTGFWTRHHLRHTLRAIRFARNGGINHAVLRGVLAMPFNSSKPAASPFLNYELFSYDEKLLSKSRVCPEFPVKFFSRAKKSVAFRIDPYNRGNGESSSQRRRTQYLFHPSLPLIVTIQQLPGSQNINVHFRR
eukprot:m.150571 g.150571  ORF g.150571 m.150571 type:complete len:594 (+) comp14235_c0_seq2:178-1959(+)